MHEPGDVILTKDFRIEIVERPLRAIPPGRRLVVRTLRRTGDLTHVTGLAVDDAKRMADEFDVIVYAKEGN